MLITYFKNYKKLNYLDIYDNFDKINIEKPDKYRHKTTWDKPIEALPRHNFNLSQLASYAEEAQSFIERGLDSFYISFKIPKRKGGFRTIEAPKEELSIFLRKIKTFIEKELKWQPHDAAYAYVKQRSCKDVLEYHKKFNSRWFLKIDITDFFGSCTEEYLHDMLKEVYPFGILLEEYADEFNKIISAACLNGRLPQGTPLSPLLSNMAFLKYDYLINSYCRRNHLVYTRYADDILISGEMQFNWQHVLVEIVQCLEKSPFRLNDRKTRFGSCSGRNWNLGLMYNKDLEITVGHERKNKMKIMLNNTFKDYTNNTNCSTIGVSSLNGLLSYYTNIEPEYFTELLKRYEAKYNVTWKEIMGC